MSTRLLTLLALFSTLAAPVAAQTDDALVLRCAQQADSGARLACFDALAAQARQRAADPRGGATAQPVGEARRVAEFGRIPKPDPNDLATMSSHVPGPFLGWDPGQRFKLANGQVWEVSDGSSGFGNGRDVAVTVRRGAMGTFFMEFAGVRNGPRVRRVD